MSSMPTEQARRNVLLALQRGEFDVAGSALLQLQALAPEHPQTHYLRGLVALAGDDPATAREPLRTAATLLPNDAAVQANWSLCLQRLGEHDAALQASEHMLALAPNHADGHFNRALILRALNRYDDAVAALERAVALAPDHAQAWIRLGQVEHARGQYLPAELALRRARTLRPQDATVGASLAALLYDAGAFDDALAQADAAVGLDPALASAHLQRAGALRRLGRIDESFAACARVLALDPGNVDALKARGLLHQMRNTLVSAADDLSAAAATRFAPGRDNPHAGMRELRRSSRAKLRHDIEQFQHLERVGALPQAASLHALHEAALRDFPSDARDAQAIELPADLLRALDGNYNRLHHLAPAPRLDDGALNPKLDGAAIERDYFARGPGITWIDDLLRPDAMQALRRYCMESTFWFDFHHANGYLGAFFEDGFAAPLLLQIAEDLRRTLPHIFKDYPLTQLWAFKYDSTLDGIELHADIAAVNLNFWITPDEANLDPERGGLVVWDKEAPPDWGFNEFNTSTAAGQARIQTFLERGGAQMVRVPYRQNRAVLFNSDLFHRTDTIRFRDGYENRRINVTMLFGQRDGRIR